MGTLQILVPLITNKVGGSAPVTSLPAASGGWGVINGAEDAITGHDDSDLLDIINGVGVAFSQLALISLGFPTTTSGSLELGFNQSDEIFVLDGNPPIKFTDLPSGFTITSLIASLTSSIFSPALGIGSLELSSDVSGVTPDTTTSSSSEALSIDLLEGGPLANLDFITSHITIAYTGITSNHSPADVGGECRNFSLVGSYTSVAFQYQLDTPNDPVQAGDQVTVTSPDVDGIDFTQILAIQIIYPDGPIDVTDIITEDTHLLIFTIPDLPGDPSVIEIVITSTQFSGSVSLGKLITIFFLNAPGVYRLVAGKTADTLYDTLNGGTVEVKIPDPNWKTGFVGG